MKVKIALILSLIFSTGIYAADAKICDKASSLDVTNDGLKTIMVAGLKINQSEFKDIQRKLCTYLSISDSTGFKPKEFKKIILDGMGVFEHASNANQVVSSFLNDHKSNLKCDAHSILSGNRNILLFKTALIDGVIDLFDEILLDDENYEIDFNGYEMVNGKKETVIDYIDKLLKTGSYDRAELVSIREVIVDLGGKKGDEL